MMVHHVDRQSELLLDDALCPILITTWIGPATLGLVAKLRDWVDEQVELANGSPLVMISDATWVGRPSAEVRRALADLTVDTKVVIPAYVVLSNPMVRGAMTAIGWMIGEKFSVISCSTVDEALDQACVYVRSLGLLAPSDGELARYWIRVHRRRAERAEHLNFCKRRASA